MKKLLIVDDNLDYLDFLVTVLENYFEVYKASGVKEALQVLKSKKVDAICSDFNMGDGTGLELLEKIRQKDLIIPFLLMSGNDDWRLEQEAQLYGGTYCCKADYDLIANIKALVEPTKNI